MYQINIYFMHLLMSQIKTKGYATPWLAGGKRIIQMGICTVGSSSVRVKFAE